ncbi:collagen-like protein [Agrilactobacillus fermenti]|uniref:collagen-like triple helix repeat-containing protein n=1 Tax=Agrilactobacillus fermenti TaxID=2586909 RepID=UPI001E2B1E56|nr:collagen-like protein [Agrilactobacillus fermenti]MCD2255868.1 collagen-like protein [Agrilactobacillus fermenti]
MKRFMMGFVLAVVACISFGLLNGQVSAASNSAGQSIIKNLENGANGGKLKVNDSDLNQVRNYVNSGKTTVTQDQANIANNAINEVRGIVESAAPDARTYTQAVEKLSADQKTQIRNIVYKAARALGLSVMFNQGTAGNSSNDTTGTGADTPNDTAGNAANGTPGADGTNGSNGTNGKNGTNGVAGETGANGVNGTNGTDGSLMPTLTDRAGNVVYQPASPNGSNGTGTIVKQTGNDYLISIISFLAILAVAGLGYGLIRKNQRVDA